MLRLATLGFLHETNTFSRVPADYAQFERSGVLHGDEIVRQFATSNATMAGYLAAAERLGVEVVPLFFAWTGPIGTITADAFERLTGEMVRLLREQGPWDGVLLAQHGAAVSEQFADADGETARRVRACVGPDVPIGMTLDMHANVSRAMIDNTTATVVYRSTPHLDPKDRALECAEIIVRAIKGEVRPVQALETPPLAINILEHNTNEEPMLGVVRDVEAAIGRPAMLSASAAEGYSYADVAEMGMAFLAIHDGDAGAAREAACWLARRVWERREEMVGDALPPEEALRMAAAAPAGPVVVLDVGDNIGGGSSADSTHLLAAAKRMGIRSYLQSLYDPEAVAACMAAGVGATVTLKVGGKTDDLHGAPVEVTGRVRVLCDGKYEDPTPTHGGFRFYDGGTTAVLETTDDHTLLLTSIRSGNTSLEQMYAAGIRPETKQVVVAKGVQSPKPAYQRIAKQMLYANTPGVTTADLSFFTYHRRRRPLFPFERDATYP